MEENMVSGGKKSMNINVTGRPEELKRSKTGKSSKKPIDIQSKLKKVLIKSGQIK